MDIKLWVLHSMPVQSYHSDHVKLGLMAISPEINGRCPYFLW